MNRRQPRQTSLRRSQELVANLERRLHGAVCFGLLTPATSAIILPAYTLWTNDGVTSKLEMMEMNIAILGAPGVGKSTFIQHAFNARQPPTTAVQSRRVSIGDALCIVRLVELNLESIELADNGEVRWPKFVDGQPTPMFHGAMTLYDIKNRDSLSMIPDVLNGLTEADIPCILVSCKCDGPSGARQINPNKIEQAGIILSGVECFQTSADSPDTQKRCLNAVVKAIKMSRTEEMKPLGVRQRSNSISQHEQPMSPQPRGQQGSRHSRASSEQAALGQKSPGVKDASQYPNDGVTRRSSRSNRSKSSAHRVSSRSGSNSAKPGQRQGDPRHASQNGLGLTMVSDAPFKSSAGTRVVESFLDMDDEKDDAYPDIDDVPLLDRRDNESIMEKPAKATGDTLEDLVDRLLGQPVSKADTNFGTTFLCLYRKFATPGKLLESIIRRFDSMESEEASYMSRISSQLRHIGVLVRWTTDYPGDFAHPHTRNRLGSFMSRIATKRVFAVAVQQMRANLDAAIEDEDGIWAMADSDHNREYNEITDSFLSTTSSVRSSIATISAPSGSDDLERQLSAMTADTEETLLGSPTTSNARSTGASNITIISTGSSQTLPTSVEAAEREAQLLLPAPRTHLTKLQWHAFMETSDEDIATELTRIDWIMFSAIRPRDLIRHVSLPADKKETCKSVENVNRMINHFNHVAYWVANMILLRDKPKHRAQALEKFMSVAWKLRYLNNYNALGAVIAGINGNAVHRLTQTRELVAHEPQKNFMRLEILMGTQRSHFAYRLAWENTSSERIPFLPLHRRDLVSAEQGNRTFIGDHQDRINWKKFQVMGDVIVGLQRSRSNPYPELSRNIDVQRLILECIFYKDDDALYERSIQLEVPGAGATDPSRKKFPWFQR